MTNLTLRTVLALFVAVAVSACDESSPTSPSASSGTTLSALADGDGGQRQAAHHGKGAHDGGGTGGPNGEVEDTFHVVVTVGGQTSEFDAIGHETFIEEAPGVPANIDLSDIPSTCTEPNDGDFTLQILGTKNGNNFPPILVIEYSGLTFNGARLRYGVTFGPNGTAAWEFPDGQPVTGFGIPTSDSGIDTNTASGATVNISARGGASGCGAREQVHGVSWTVEVELTS